jgi:membrane fusion protein (multidrug efflux system)
MKKRIILTILGVILLIGALGAIKVLQIRRMIDQGAQFTPPPEVVTTAVAQAESWESLLTAVGSLVAVQGVIVTAELPGKVVRIAFEPGQKVQTGDLLVRQDTSTEDALLRAAEATAALARINLDRLGKLLAQGTIAQAQYDDTEAQYRQAVAQADSIRAAIGKKTIRAPFAGLLGIRLINLGQMLKEGEAMVSLQALDPIFVDFALPQQQLAHLQRGLAVRLTTDALPGEVVEGEITAINPQVDAATRNIMIQATVANSRERLRPGMFVNVAVTLPLQDKMLTIPAPAVLYAPYSDSVFVVEEKKDEKTGLSGKAVRQQFVRLGEKRGDYVSVMSGLKEGETIVSTGVFKLRNGQAVIVNNSLSPEFKLAPKPEDS